jgi:hypothetical protein
MDKIVDGLYLGDIRAASNLFLLKSHVSVLTFLTTFQIEHYSHTLSPMWAEPLLSQRKYNFCLTVEIS